jgi:hypothetical protein
MQHVTLSFPNLSYMAYFIIDCGISDFTPDWKNASLTGRLKDTHIGTAFAEYNAYVLERETTIYAE